MEHTMAIPTTVEIPYEVEALLTQVPGAIYTGNMSMEDWLELRKSSLGGSEIASIVGMNPYDTALGVYASKKGLVPPFEESEAMYWGKRLEPIIADEFAVRNGWKVVQVDFMLRHPDYSFLTASIDRLIVHPDLGFGILECKTTKEYNSSKWKDDLPAHNYMQVMWYLAITGFDYAYAACLVGGSTYKQIRIERDEAIIRFLIQSGIDFWLDNVMRSVPPDVMHGDVSTLNTLYPQHTEGFRYDMNEAESYLMEQLLETRKYLRDAEKQADLAKAEIQALMGEHEAIYMDDVKQVSWKTSKKNVRVFKVHVEENDG